MKVFIKYHDHGAGLWIYDGYKKAWEALGYECFFYKNLLELKNETNFYLMGMANDVKSDEEIKILRQSTKSFLFILANYFPKHWGLHPNWISSCNLINEINNLKNVIKWTFVDKCEYYNLWDNFSTIPLAFDDISYKYNFDSSYKFDVCYIGGWANNGFDEKRKNILRHFSKLKNTPLKCGIFINKNIPHDKEQKILSSSRIALNIHDDYQRELGLDTNERTFKSLGLTGVLVSDNVKQIDKVTDDIKMSSEPEEYLSLIYKELSDPVIEERKKYNRNNILNNHTYKNRVRELLNA